MTRMQLAAIWMVLAAAAVGRADTFVLNNGGRVEGELLNPQESPRESYLVRTTIGEIEIPMRQVKHVREDSADEAWYAATVAKMPNTAAGNWTMAELCRERRLHDHRRLHLENVIQLDPDHEGARLGLGYTKLGKEWVQTDLLMRSQGYVRHLGKWRAPQELALLEMSEQQEAGEIEWRRKTRMWRTWLSKPKRQAEAMQNLANIRDPLAGAALADMVEDEKNKDVKLLLLGKLAQLRSPHGVNLFLELAMTHPDPDIVDTCLDALAEYGGAQASTYLMGSGGLKSKDNGVVNRAAVALARLKDPEAVPALIDALVTEHKFVLQPKGGAGSINPVFGGGTGGLNMGGKPKVIRRDIRNVKVHDALMALVGNVDFQYDEAAWKQWLAATSTPRAVNLRRRF